MILTNKTIQYLGVIDGDMFYYDFNRNQLLLSNKKSNPALIMMLVPVTATVSGRILSVIGEQLVITQFFWRLLLLVGLSILMHLLASLISQQIIKKTDFQEVTLSEEHLQLLIKKTRFQIIALQIVNVIFYIILLGLTVDLLSNIVMTNILIFSFILMVVELTRLHYSNKTRKQILKVLTKVLTH